MANSHPDPKLNLNASGSGRLPWYEDLRVIGILLVLVGVLALPLVWFNKRMSAQKKVLITVVAVTIAAVLFVLSAWVLSLVESRADRAQADRQAAASRIQAAQTPAQS